jgi:hypothetical protein
MASNEEITPVHRLGLGNSETGYQKDEKSLDNEYDVKDSYGGTEVFAAEEEATVKKSVPCSPRRDVR